MSIKLFKRITTLTFVSVLLLLTIFQMFIVPARAPSFDSDVTIIPSSPSQVDEVNVTVVFHFTSSPPGAKFGNLTKVGNIFSVNVTVHDTTGYRFPILHDDEHTYHLGKLNAGSYQFKVYVEYQLDGIPIFHWLKHSISFIVSIKVPDDYSTIQEAINAANSGDIINVSSGIYYEHVVVNKTVSLVGENRSNTIIDGNGTGNVVYVTADNVNIRGFTIQNCGDADPADYSGIYVFRSRGNNISNNFITNNSRGIWVNDYYYGNNIVSDNILSNNEDPITLLWSIKVTISGNILTNNGGGIFLYDSNGTISNNVITNNDGGIAIEYMDGNIVSNNTLSNSNYGIFLSYSNSNIVTDNAVSKEDYGIRLDYSHNNTIFHNNFINNTQQVYIWDNSSISTWDDGYPSGGNYWSDYNGTDLYSGPYQNESGSDGIGDNPYIIDSNNTDNYPLMNPWGSVFKLNHPEIISIFQVHLEVDAYLPMGFCLTVKFYSYGGLYQGNVTVWNGTTSAHVTLSMNLSHPLDNPLDWNKRVPVERATLVLTDENGTVISSVTTFVMTRNLLFKRLVYLIGRWPFIVIPIDRILIFREIIYISKQWPYAPP